MKAAKLWSKDHYLLIRMYTDLVLLGYPECTPWNYGSHAPFGEDYNSLPKEDCHLLIDENMQFHNHRCYQNFPRIEITNKNYLTVLEQFV